MSHLNQELLKLRTDVTEMWQLVLGQLTKGKEALETFDKDIALEIVSNEKRINSYELLIDRQCANMLALYTPVAVDLRFVLAVLKITANLERIADNLESIARYIMDVEHPFDEDLMKNMQMEQMLDMAIMMQENIYTAFEREDDKLARKVFKKDAVLDEINMRAPKVTADFIRLNPDKIEQCLYLLSVVRKIERVGDQSKNIGEEIIYFLKAKVLKHRKKKVKKDEIRKPVIRKKKPETE